MKHGGSWHQGKSYAAEEDAARMALALHARLRARSPSMAPEPSGPTRSLVVPQQHTVSEFVLSHVCCRHPALEAVNKQPQQHTQQQQRPQQQSHLGGGAQTSPYAYPPLLQHATKEGELCSTQLESHGTPMSAMSGRRRLLPWLLQAQEVTPV